MVIHNYYYTPNLDRYASYFFTRIITRPWQLPLKPGMIVPRMTTDVKSSPLERSTAVGMETLSNHRHRNIDIRRLFYLRNCVKIVTKNWWQILYRLVLMSCWLGVGGLIAKREGVLLCPQHRLLQCPQHCLAAPLWWQANFLIRDDRN